MLSLAAALIPPIPTEPPLLTTLDIVFVFVFVSFVFVFVSFVFVFVSGGRTDPRDSHWSPIAHNTPLPMRNNDECRDDHWSLINTMVIMMLKYFGERILYFLSPTVYDKALQPTLPMRSNDERRDDQHE